MGLLMCIKHHFLLMALLMCIKPSQIYCIVEGGLGRGPKRSISKQDNFGVLVMANNGAGVRVVGFGQGEPPSVGGGGFGAVNESVWCLYGKVGVVESGGASLLNIKRCKAKKVIG